jgi:hypothetical protein
LVGITTEEKEVDNILKRTPLCVVSINCVVAKVSLSREKKSKRERGRFFKTGSNTLNTKKPKKKKSEEKTHHNRSKKKKKKKKKKRSHTTRKKE